MTNDLPNLLDRIQALVDGRGDDDPERLLERLEHTLTDGYAYALHLQGAILRLERNGASRERRAEVENELKGLRERLLPLKLRTEAVASELALR